jgi:hypothetical protein
MDARLNYSSLLNRRHPLNRGLVAWWLCLPTWRGGVTWRDIAGTHHGTLTNMDPATDWAGASHPGGFGRLDFDGSDDHVLISGHDRLSFGNAAADSPFSLDAVVRMTDATSFHIFGVGTNAAREYSFRVDANDKLSLALYDNDGSNLVSYVSTDTLTSLQGEWVHLAVTYSGSGTGAGITGYLNGLPLAGSVVNLGTYVAMHNQSGGAAIGRFMADGLLYASGSISSLRLWRRALSAAEVQQVCQDARRGHRLTLNRVFVPAWAVLPTITGEISQTGPAANQSASGTPVTAGTAAQTAQPAAQSASGTPLIVGTAAQSGPKAQQSASGTPVIVGSVAQTGPAAQQSAYGPGYISQTGPAATQAASGTPVIVGSISQTATAPQQSVSGTPIVTGAIAQAGQAARQTASGTPVVIGTIEQTGPTAEQAATNIDTITGTAAQTGPAANQAAAGTPVIVGTAAQTHRPATQALSGTPVVSGTATQTAPTAEQSASGVSTVTGVIAQTARPARQVASGTSIITGTIDQVGPAAEQSATNLTPVFASRTLPARRTSARLPAVAKTATLSTRRTTSTLTGA